jgi:hypothetical protein
MKLALAVISKWIGLLIFVFGLVATLPLGSREEWQTSEGIPGALERIKELKDDSEVQFMVQSIEGDRERIFGNYEKKYEPRGLFIAGFGLLLAIIAGLLQKELRPKPNTPTRLNEA